jgi:hypothetical protein
MLHPLEDFFRSGACPLRHWAKGVVLSLQLDELELELGLECCDACFR